MKPKTLFPVVPEDLSSVSDDDLAALAASFQTRARAINATRGGDADALAAAVDAVGDADFAAALDATEGPDVVAQMTDGVVALERVRAEITAREAAQAEYGTTVGDLAAQFGIEDAPAAAADDVEPGDALEDDTPTGDEPTGDVPAGDEPSGEAAAADVDTAAADTSTEDAPTEPVTASAKPRLRRPPIAPRSHQARAAVAERAAPLTASAGFEGIMRPGEKLDRAGLAMLLGEAQATLGRPKHGKDKAIVASARVEYPIDRQLGDDPNHNWELIQAVVSDEAVTASGGFCAPYTPLYNLPIVAVADRPVRDALASFQATRGGITFPTPLGISDVIDGITVVTPEEDEEGGSSSIKNCVVIDCDPFQSAAVEAIAACVEHGNLNARAWPERVANVTDLLAAAHAQVAETELLAALTAGSTNVIDPVQYGAYATILQGTLKAAAAYRSRHRMRPDTRLRTLYPAWLPDAIAADFAFNGFNRLDAAAVRSNVEALLSRANVNVSWYMDEDGTTQQTYGAQAGSGATLLGFLDKVVWYLFHEGAWLFLDMGRLDLGIVRDSSLNSTNDFEVFWETFEGAAFVGIESLRVESDLCVSGATAGTLDPSDVFDCAIAA